MPLTVRNPRPLTGGGGRGPVDHHDRGGGGGGGGRGDGVPNYGEQLRRYRLGMAVMLIAVVVVFVAMTSAYVVRLHLDPPGVIFVVPPDPPLRLPLALLWFNTSVLLLSSLTLELARRQAAERALLAPLRSIPGISVDAAWRRPWLALSVLLGFVFLAGQAGAWHLLMKGGQDFYAGMGSTFFYILTGLHAIHLAGGLIALLYAGATSLVLRKPQEIRRIVVDVVSWYWHVMALLWLYIFGLLSFVR